ncbi:MAG: pyruvate kinase [Deltaproteobacteria bacterium]|nr:pyruvate kinase [Deltaproteobacteria bacterium]
MSPNKFSIPTKRKTKIVVTIGPASSSAEVIRKLIGAGMNVARLNFSHGSYAEHEAVLNHVRNEAANLGQHVAVMVDLCGPKVRIGAVKGGEIILKENDNILLSHFDGSTGNHKTLYVEAFDPREVMKVGETALLADGRIELKAEEVTSKGVRCRICAGGIVRSRSGIAVPDSTLNLPCITDKDLSDIAWATEHEADYIALSFVSNVRDVLRLREIVRSRNSSSHIIAKIERASSLDNINEIIEASDAVMVARGDLGLELPFARVPLAQKLIIETANYHGTPVITATQMLQSMVTEVRPTRAEVSDVCTAVKDGTDAVMLSEETAVGKYPVHVVETLDKILVEVEAGFEFEEYKPRLKGADRETVADAICYAACGAANKVGASAILACTQSGHTAQLVAKYRPQQALFGATSEKKVLARMALYWGVYPVLFSIHEEHMTEAEVVSAMITVRDQFGLKPGSRVVVTAGLRAKKSGTTSLMEIREIPR